MPANPLEAAVSPNTDGTPAPFPDREERWVLGLHLLFGLACLALLLPLPGGPGLWVMALVVLYNAAIVLVSRLLRLEETWRLWCFLAPLSALQLIPDGFLATVLGVLEFPLDGVPKVFSVSVFMAGMWTIPLFVIVFVGRRVEARHSRTAALWAVALLSLVLFAGSEATLWRVPIWMAHEVRQVGHVALYVLVPEIVLGLAAFLAYEHHGRAPWPTRLLAAFTVMLIYLGALCTSYLLIEGLPGSGLPGSGLPGSGLPGAVG